MESRERVLDRVPPRALEACERASPSARVPALSRGFYLARTESQDDLRQRPPSRGAAPPHLDRVRAV